MEKYKKPQIPENRFWVHQIFGLLGDTELPELFKINQQKTLKWCKDNNYSYRLWDKKSCDLLIKKYPEFIDLYNNAKYDIMRVDIIRFLILHYYGGLYLDMDCCPNIDKLKEQDKFILAWRVTGAEKHKNRPPHYEMEVIQSYPCNHILTDFLRYVKTQIIEKDKIKIYETWKCRYVFHTTGPFSLNRFLKKNKLTPEKYNLNFPLTYDNSLNIIGNEDFISYPACSYLNKMG